ncbi:unnamed protein product [Effrenium voratum]|nr:unnamed protein product [Effrenium voratum]
MGCGRSGWLPSRVEGVFCASRWLWHGINTGSSDHVADGEVHPDSLQTMTFVGVREERRRALTGLNHSLRPRTAQLGALARISSAPQLAPGCSVRLAGLRSRAEFNGTAGEVVERDPDAHGQVLVRLFPDRDSQKLVWVGREKLHPEESPLNTRAGKQWLSKPLRHLAHHSFKRAPHGGFFSEGTSQPLLLRDTQRST